VDNLLACFVVEHKFTTMYKLKTNGLIERTNMTLCSMLAKWVEVHVNICDYLKSTMLCGITTLHTKLSWGIHLFV
jgi:hypothetical protein